MLKQLFISKVRIKILEQFFLNPLDQYHVRGLVRLLDEEINAIRRELINLQEIGILKSEHQTNKIVFTLNPNCPILDELRTIVIKDSLLGHRVSKLATSAGKPVVIVLSHCYLTKEYSDSSDVDFLFLGQFDITKLSKLMKEFEVESNREYKYTAMSIPDFEFGKKKRDPLIMNVINKEFVVLYGQYRKLIS
ncbi:hypothetical protein M0R04_01680 [Candidatus Dojkabacteria bacterium]|jgi:hypothetical protein|nr:hypothetical protein [Candidatus Dojkabacteria bacterium]